MQTYFQCIINNWPNFYSFLGWEQKEMAYVGELFTWDPFAMFS